MSRGVLMLAAFLAAVSAGAETSRPNVVLIVADDLNDSVGHLGGHPQARTPHIDRLAASGVSFRRAYSNNPICAPSRSSFLTGIYPHTSRNMFFDKWFENPVLAGSRTLMELFRDNGYRVVGTGKLMHHLRRSNWDEFPYTVDYGPMPFDGDERVGHPSVPRPFRDIGPIDGSFGPLSDVPFGGEGGTGWAYSLWGAVRLMRYASEDDRDPTPDERSARWAARRIAELAEDDAERPFFLAVGFLRPHTPLHVPRRYFDMFPLETLQLPVIRLGDAEDTHYRDVFTEEVKGLRYYRTLVRSYPTREDGLRAFVQAYLAAVAALDDQVGVVLDAIDRSPLKDDTIVVMTSDHGWNNGQKDYLFKNALWEESARVPLVVRAPGVGRDGGIAEHPVGLIDLYPTLVDLCGLTGDTRKNAQGRPLDGHSLRPFLEDPSRREWDGPDFALTMVHAAEHARVAMSPEDARDPARQHWSVRTERWRYIRYNNGAEELYDHEADPYEWQNLARAPEHTGVLGSMRSRLDGALGQ